jgi:acetolactate synthase-1/2/3 large subunit
MHDLARSSAPASAFVTDVGQHQMWAAQSLELGDDQRFLTSGGMGAMGFALPASVGAACARPGQRIVALIGDGSFGMSGTELETVARMNLPITFVQFNNGTFGWIKMLQKLYFDDRYHNVDFSTTVDYAGAATALGVPGVRIEHADQLNDAIAESLRADGPRFIDVPTQSELEETPPVHAWQQALGLA